MRIAIIGGGAAGLCAAGSAVGANVTVLDRSEKVGKKIYITGKGRCNFTNVCDVNEFLQNVVTNPLFLRSALSGFSPDNAVALIEQNGCKTKVERGRRAFPQSDKASDIIKALTAYAKANSAELQCDCEVTDIKPMSNGFAVTVNGKDERYDKVIVCTGGMSYPSTGSDGSAFKILKKLGHTVIEPVPSLVGLSVKKPLRDAQGLTLKNITVSAEGIKPVFGDAVITSDGISGPAVLTLSALTARRPKPFAARLDLKPALSPEELDARVLRDFEANKNKQFKNALDMLLPKSVIKYIIEASGVLADKPVNSVTKAERLRLVGAIKSYPLEVTGGEGFERAVITSGGVCVKEIDPKTMGSKLVKGLYFGGEVIDVDALTGGYNFHIALATGYSAGKHAALA